MKSILKRYKVSILMIFILLSISIFIPSKGKEAINMTTSNVIEMVKVIPPIFLLLGLLDVWVPREKMIKFMGNDSGFVGVIIAFLLGSAAAGPLYAAFPIGGTLLKKGASFSNVLIFIGAWSTTKLPLLLFEGSSLGWKFTITRLVINLIGIFVIAKLTNILLSKDDRDYIYELSEDM
ncbi:MULTISPECIES: permease [Paraclostridium]|uniref:Permease n=1 Tax=Paraclostridium benzoelyticum TaxID=1629550 RepID=A0A0M3DFW5_9FIRM|nr:MULTISPECIES: permease [Paraclostridium]KKY01510.1 permease [Paraclostridium benzoelyticum]MCU9814086.1 permease [Paraclostridium sp. AKS73]MDM8127504.1 permease [Paraclostridium benzoelyticum]OXX83166.1 permease [Paraclostridium benzoelyticum]